MNLFNGKVHENDEWRQINLLISDRQILITPNIVEINGKRTLNYFSLSLGSIEKCEVLPTKKKETARLRIIMKDNREIFFRCVLGDLITKVCDIISNFAFVKGVNRLYAFRYGALNFKKEEEFKGWQIYNIKSEFLRQGLLTEEQGGLPFKYIDNGRGQFCETYP